MSVAPPVIVSLTFQAAPSTTPGAITVILRYQLAGGQQPYAATWDFGDGTTSTVSLPILSPGAISSLSKDYPASAFSPNPPTVKLTITDTAGLQATQSITLAGVGMPPPPTQPQVLIYPKIISQNQTTARVQFTATVIGFSSVLGISWNFGDGTAVVQAPSGVTHDYALGPQGGGFLVIAIATGPFIDPTTGQLQTAAGNATVKIGAPGPSAATTVAIVSLGIAAIAGGYYLLSRQG